MRLIADFDALCFVEGILHLDIINRGGGVGTCRKDGGKGKMVAHRDDTADG